jgi:hypothetical protein
MTVHSVSQAWAESAEMLHRRWGESRRKFDQTRVDVRRFDSLAKLVARMHRERCQQVLMQPAAYERRAA